MHAQVHVNKPWPMENVPAQGASKPLVRRCATWVSHIREQRVRRSHGLSAWACLESNVRTSPGNAEGGIAIRNCVGTDGPRHARETASDLVVVHEDAICRTTFAIDGIPA